MEAFLQNTTKNGSSPLHCAAQNGHVEVAKALIDEYNADLTARDNVSVTMCYTARCLAVCIWTRSGLCVV